MQHDEARAKNHACDDAETAARAYGAWLVVNVLVGVATDIHNEWTICDHSDSTKKYKQRKCNHCGAIRNRNITTLVHHINNQCPNAKNKYHSNGQLKSASATLAASICYPYATTLSLSV